MRRYSLFFTLFLSLLLPLHGAANTLLSATGCPAQSNMQGSSSPMQMHMDMQHMDMDHMDMDMNHMDMDMNHMDMDMPDCCHGDGAADCMHMQACSGCTINSPAFALLTPLFIPNHSSFSNAYLAMALPFAAAINPASLWRPPTHS
jgi:uncharacterized protein involved in copper resistance